MSTFTAAKVAVDKLSADVTSKSIPDVSGSSGVLSYGMSKAHIVLYIDSTRITGFTSPGSAVRTDAGSGITMALSNVGVSVHGNWNYHLKWLIFSLRDSGSFDVSVTGVTLRVSFGMGVDSNGRPTIHTKSCSCYVGNVNVKFHGGASWFYNIFSCVVEEKISDKIRSQLCTSLQNVINDKASKTLQNTKVTLDYSLVAAPEFGSNYLQLLHRGEFFWTSTNTGTTSLPPPIEDLPGPLKMLPASVRQIMKLANYPQGMELTITGHLTNERIISSVQHFEINIADKSGIIGGTTVRFQHKEI
ncbi:hypothetical protein LSH36_348g00002 [Paralvinella palmiformis]|uniref:Lipid-binding serum glycoprotein N-terminal domain-containing protein n=1 Tax=Paralvinella palmiformis TaxID=53620 RepID=A0AAD9N1R6_9ANNE|nr:hypothetical protein LSH36_348g00002 [Paralvinella palmiformis]